MILHSIESSYHTKSFSMSIIEEIISELHGACIFSKLDVRLGYYQIRMTIEDIFKTTFKTHKTHHKFMIMSFGLTNTPAIFQAMMNLILHHFLENFLWYSFKTSSFIAQHWNNTRIIWDKFQTLHDSKLFIKPSKCSFSQSQVIYLGHMISSKCLKADSDKLETIRLWTTPKNIEQLRSFFRNYRVLQEISFLTRISGSSFNIIICKR